MGDGKKPCELLDKLVRGEKGDELKAVAPTDLGNGAALNADALAISSGTGATLAAALAAPMLLNCVLCASEAWTGAAELPANRDDSIPPVVAGGTAALWQGDASGVKALAPNKSSCGGCCCGACMLGAKGKEAAEAGVGAAAIGSSAEGGHPAGAVDPNWDEDRKSSAKPVANPCWPVKPFWLLAMGEGCRRAAAVPPMINETLPGEAFFSTVSLLVTLTLDMLDDSCACRFRFSRAVESITNSSCTSVCTMQVRQCRK